MSKMMKMTERIPCATCYPEADHDGRLCWSCLCELRDERDRLREALWNYREQVGHLFVNDNPDEGCERGCPGCFADALFGPKEGEDG